MHRNRAILMKNVLRCLENAEYYLNSFEYRRGGFPTSERPIVLNCTLTTDYIQYLSPLGVGCVLENLIRCSDVVQFDDK